MPGSDPRAHGEQVLLLEAGMVTVAAVPLDAEAVERLVELGLAPLAGGVGPGGDRRPVEGLEVLAVVARALEGRDLEHVALERVELDAAAHQRLQVLLAAPQRRGLRARGRGRHERLHHAEQRAEHALRGPAEQPDRAAGAGDAHELVGGRLVVGREHHADRRHHDVERAVREREVLGVRLGPLELEALAPPRGAGPPPAAPASGRSRSRCAPRAAAGREALPVPAATSSTRVPSEMGRVDQPRAERQQERLHHVGVVARGPHRAVARLELRVCDVDCHLASPFGLGCEERIRAGAARRIGRSPYPLPIRRTRGGSRRSVRLSRMRTPRPGSRVDRMTRLILLALLGVLILPATALAAPAKISPRPSAVSDSGVATVEVANPNRYALRGTAKVTARGRTVAKRTVRLPKRSVSPSSSASAARPSPPCARPRAAPRSSSSSVAPTAASPPRGERSRCASPPARRRRPPPPGAARAARLRPLGRPDGQRGRLRRSRAHRRRRAAPGHQGPFVPVSCFEMGGSYRSAVSLELFDAPGPWTIGTDSLVAKQGIAVNQLVSGGARTINYKVTGPRSRPRVRAPSACRSPTPSTTSSPTPSRSSTAPARQSFEAVPAVVDDLPEGVLAADLAAAELEQVASADLDRLAVDWVPRIVHSETPRSPDVKWRSSP